MKTLKQHSSPWREGEGGEGVRERRKEAGRLGVGWWQRTREGGSGLGLGVMEEHGRRRLEVDWRGIMKDRVSSE